MPHRTLLVPPGYADLIRNTPGLVAYWRLGERGGTVARGELRGTDGTYASGVTLGRRSLTDAGGSAVLFNGKYVTLPALALAAAQPRTIAMWVSPSYASGNLEVLFAYQTSALYVLDSGAGGRNVRLYDGAANGTANPAVVVTDKVIHLCVAVYNGTGWVFSLDGSLLGTPVTGSGQASSTASYISRAANPWYGTIGDTAVWGRALNNNEIRTLYDVGRGR